MREAYQGHVAKVLELTGVPTADAAQQAARVMAFETRLARVSKSAEEMSRDVSLYYNPTRRTDADKLTPNFPWTVVLHGGRRRPAAAFLARRFRHFTRK